MKIKINGFSLMWIWLIVFSVLPLVFILAVSFLTKNDIHWVSLPWTWASYTHLLSPLFAKIFYRSCLMAASTCGLCVLLAYPFSYFLIKSRHQSLLLLLIMIPFWTSSLMRTYALLSILKLHGILNDLLLYLHIIKTPHTWLYSSFSVQCGLIYTLLPFMVLPIFTNMEQFDFRLIEAAKDLGARSWTIFFHVFLPNTLQGVMAGCLLVFLPTMTLFYIPQILGGSRSMLLGNLIQNQFIALDNWPQGAATSCFLTITLFVFLAIFRRKKNI